jgi:adenylate kinase family enzyme
MHVPPLEKLGPRVAIFGPSNAGKSSLAVAIGRQLGVEPIHLDLLHHQPGTEWQPRPPEEFEALHAAAIDGARWVMEGNYMRLLESRAARATGLILLGTGRWSALRRYVLRTLFDRRRLGVHAGTRDRINSNMVRFIMLEQPKKRERDVALLRSTGVAARGTAVDARVEGALCGMGAAALGLRAAVNQYRTAALPLLRRPRW